MLQGEKLAVLVAAHVGFLRVVQIPSDGHQIEILRATVEPSLVLYDATKILIQPLNAVWQSTQVQLFGFVPNNLTIVIWKNLSPLWDVPNGKNADTVNVGRLQPNVDSRIW
jgi:hypothetical protein